MITDNYIPCFRVNQWLELKSIRKASTGQEYAKKMTVFLNWLDSNGVSFEDATNRHVRQFLHFLIFGDMQNGKILSLQSTVSSSTLEKYITVITGFYRWLDEVSQTEMLWKSKSIHAGHSFLYGQIYSYEYRYLVDGYATMLKPGRDYHKWYDTNTKKALCENFQTLRDEAVLRLTFEGFRIDEALSVTFDSYNATERLIQPTRSKGKPDAHRGNNRLRLVALPESVCSVLNRYIQTERAIAETGSGKISQYLFINLNVGKAQGEPLHYRNYLKILKRCAKRAGLDESKIRTHNGRSTKVMEFLEHQALHPEDNITDGIIMESFGWRSFSSIDHYRDHNNPIIAKAVMEKLHKGGEQDE
jgi:site-specific recombinase XerD